MHCSSVSLIACLWPALAVSAYGAEPAPVESDKFSRIEQVLGNYAPRLAPPRALDIFEVEPVQIGVLQATFPFPEISLAPGDLSRNFRIELEALRARVKAEGFLSVEEILQSGLVDAPPEKRLDAVLILTTLYISHGLHAEALSLLGELGDANVHADFALLRGISSFKMGRDGEAIAAFSEDVLRDNVEAVRWRGIANERRGAYKAAAVDLFEAPAGVLSFEENTSAFLFAKAETAIALEEYAVARAALKGLQRSSLNNKDRAQRGLLEARLMLFQNRVEPARQSLERLVQSGPAPFANMAAIELLNDSFNHGTLDPDGAADRANALMLTWRGGAFERRALTFTATMQEAAGDIGAAYHTRRQIMERFPHADASAAAEQKMRAGLSVLLEKGALSPLDAAQIFYENIDLAPPGRDGDVLIRNVADKLIALDLVTQAAELLHHQTFGRLRGEDRSRTASDLAKLYLTDGKPAMALQVLRSTRLARLPEAVNDQRRQFEARALIETGDKTAALALLKNETSVEGAKLRADIYWSEQQWILAGNAFTAAAALPPEIDGQLGREQSVLVLRAASAYGLAGAQAELRRLGRHVSGRLADTDANHLLDGLAFGGLADNPAEFRAAYRAFFGDLATAS